MITEYKIKPQLKYGKYFLNMEADDEEEAPKKRNTKVIDVKPNNRRRLDYTAGADEPEDDTSKETPVEDETTDTTTNDEANDAGTAEVDTGDTQDYTADTDATVDDGTGTNDTGTTEVDTGDTQDYTDGADDTGDTTTDTTTDTGTDATVDDGTGGDNTDNGEVEVDTGDTQDYTDGADDTGDTTTDTTTDTNITDSNATDTNNKGPGLEYDSTRKYVLFENYISLSNAINNYISKLENIIGEDIEYNKLIRTATNKLREIDELCESYMTMKFEASGYIQSLLFYQNLVVMIQLVLDSLSKVQKAYIPSKNNKSKLKH